MLRRAPRRPSAEQILSHKIAEYLADVAVDGHSAGTPEGKIVDPAVTVDVAEKTQRKAVPPRGALERA